MRALWFAPAGKRLADLSRELGLHKTTVLRLLRTLVAIGVARRDETSDCYLANPAPLIGITYGQRDIARATDTVQSILEDVAEATDMLALLMTPDPQGGTTVIGGSAVPRSWVPPDAHEKQPQQSAATASEKRDLMRLSPPEVQELLQKLTRPGALARLDTRQMRIEPIHMTASGKIFLAAGLSPTRLQKWMRGGSPRITEHATASLERLGEELAQIREQRYAVSDQEALPGISSLAVPVQGAEGKTVAALVIAAPSEKFAIWSARSIARLLHRASERISELLRASRLDAGAG